MTHFDFQVLTIPTEHRVWGTKCMTTDCLTVSNILLDDLAQMAATIWRCLIAWAIAVDDIRKREKVCFDWYCQQIDIFNTIDNKD